ncbi:hypothetical protein [Dyella silvatica]|uniref:hypothetical protein n=1 Tax=Dyella silvatica TaxID=2992128 RepID=UPI002259E21A|nr:hypothetical protein [Dyella silvatica]
MTPTSLLRDAYRELDETGSLSRNTHYALTFAGFDSAVIEVADNASKEPEDIYE